MKKYITLLLILFVQLAAIPHFAFAQDEATASAEIPLPSNEIPDDTDTQSSLINILSC